MSEATGSTTKHTPAFWREQIAFTGSYYLRVRPGSRAAAEVIADTRYFRKQLADALRAQRRAALTTGAQQ